MIDRDRWRRRSLAALVIWLVGWAATAALGAHPQPVLLALATAALFAVVGAAVDVREFVDQADWVPPHRARPRQWGLDPRFSRLSQSFNDGTDPQVVAERVHQGLVRVVDDMLVNRHGIDRQQDPRARAGSSATRWPTISTGHLVIAAATSSSCPPSSRESSPCDDNN